MLTSIPVVALCLRRSTLLLISDTLDSPVFASNSMLLGLAIWVNKKR